MCAGGKFSQRMATRESDDGDDIMRILEESDTRAINFSKFLFYWREQQISFKTTGNLQLPQGAPLSRKSCLYYASIGPR